MFNPARRSAFDDRSNEISPEWAAAVRETSRNNISVYSIDPEGGAIALAGATDQIFQESASYYFVGYAAPVNDQRLHRIEVKVSKKGVTVRARRARG